MDQFEKVEKLREHANVSYEDAKAALEAANGDMLDAMIILEKQGKADEGSDVYSTGIPEEEPIQNGRKSRRRHSRHDFSYNADGRACSTIKRILRKFQENHFVVAHGRTELINIPLWAAILFIPSAWEISLLLLVIGILCGCTVSLEGPDCDVDSRTIFHSESKPAQSADNTAAQSGDTDSSND